MISTASPAFMAAAVATVRKPKARVTIFWTDPWREESILASAPGQENHISWVKQVADLITIVPYKWFCLDGTTPLSQNMHPAPGTEAEAVDYQVGWWGKAVCDGAGDFAVPQILSIIFISRPIVLIKISGDSAYNEYPVDFSIKFYNGLTLLKTVAVTANTDLHWIYDISAENLSEVTGTKLSITKWSMANRVVKIAEFYSSISTVYDGDEIMSMNILEEMEIKDGSLPIGNIASNEIDLALNNVDDKFFPGNTAAPLHLLVKKNRRIMAELGFQLPNGTIEYVAMGTFWSGDWKVSENGTTASTSGRDCMELLRKSTFYSGLLYENKTLKYLAEAVLEDAKLVYPDLEYSVDADLADFIIPYGWFPKKSHFECIKMIVTACCGRAYVDRTGIIRLLGPVSTGASVLEITAANYFEREQPVNSEDIANVVEVQTQPLRPETNIQDIESSTNANPIKMTLAKHGFSTGDQVIIVDHLVNINANGTWDITVVNDNDFTLDGSVGNGVGGATGTCTLNGEEVYASSEDLSIETNETKPLTIFYKEPPVKDALPPELDVSMDGGAVVSLGAVTNYAWGADIQVNCTVGGLFRIKIKGTAFTSDGGEIVVKEDESANNNSIRVYGQQRYEFKSNTLIQTHAIAEIIAGQLLASFKMPGKDIDLNWRGNPALELADVITAPEYVKKGINTRALFSVTKQEFQFDGTLRETLTGRKNAAVEITGAYQDTDAAAISWQDTDDAVVKIQG